MSRGQKFRALRESRGIGLNELGTRADVSKTVISHWENDERDDMRLSSAIALARALSTSVDWIATGEGSPELAGSPAPQTPEDRARAAGIALGYAASAIEAGIAESIARNDATDPWEILTRIRSANRVPAPGRMFGPTSVQPYAGNENEGSAVAVAVARPAAAKTEQVTPTVERRKRKTT